MNNEDINEILKFFIYSNSLQFEDEIPNTYPIPYYREWSNIKNNKEKYIFIANKFFNTSPKSLYIGIPFCNYKCNYCVYSILNKYNTTIANKYLEYLQKELNILKTMGISFSNIGRIYIGGGTPSILTEKQFQILFRMVEASGVNLSKVKSFTCEVSPESLNNKKACIISKYANRVSIGIQDINPIVLDAINRKVKFEQIKKSLEILRDYFEYFNVDLIYGLQKQTILDWVKTIQYVVGIKVPEITLYNSRIGFNSINKEKVLTLVEEKRWLLEANEILVSEGYIQVRPFHWVRDKKIKNLWKNYKYAPFSDQHSKTSGLEIGVGNSAVSHIDNILTRNYDVTKIDLYKHYLNNGQLPIEKLYILNENDFIIRKILYGIEEGKFIFSSLDISYQSAFKVLYQNLLKYKLIEKNKNTFSLTKIGLLFYNNIEKEIIFLLKNFKSRNV